MSQRKNHRRPRDKFTGRDVKWPRFRHIPRGMVIFGYGISKDIKKARIKRLRIDVDIDL